PTSPPRSPPGYRSGHAPAQTATAISLPRRIARQTHLGIADLALNGAPVDVLDRQKLRAQATLYVGSFPVGSLAIDEASILNFITTPVTISLPIAGPVRAVGGSATQQVALYASRADLAVALDVAEQPLPGVPGTTVRLDALRLSLDLLDPAASGLAPATYYDSNTPAGAAIDGMPDAVPVQPLAGWQQVAGAAGGFVNVLSVTLQSGTVSNHYLDDAALDPGDTGDGRSFGDAGFAVANPDGRLTVRQVLYFLPGGAGNVGAAFAAQAGRALQVETAVEPPVAGFGVYLAVVKRN
ncbi:MAG: hypothetical protein KC425_11515, partial [Anaerolineales bacterium]|nr:hypothetical protein [Anaerolineales bacterium]